jgi:hypothetical protein
MPEGETSVEGFDPCFFFDFSSAYTFKYKLNCKSINAKGLISLEPSSIGYHYKDLITPIPTFETLPLGTKARGISNKKITLTFDFRDWKFLSNTQRYQATVTDPEIITGQKEGEIVIDFSLMRQSDSAKKSMFEVAGRVYYEAHVFGYKVSSFTSSGFLDREGYQVPEVSSSRINAIKENYGVIIALAIVGLIALKSMSSKKEKVKK